MLIYRKLSPIQAMTFDLDDTLYDNRPVIRHLEQQVTLWLEREHPVTATRSADWWQAVKRKVVEQDAWLKNDVSLWRLVQIRTALMELGYERPAAQQAAEAAMVEVLRLRNLVDVPAETHQVLSELAARMPLVAITNGNVDAEKIGLSGYFKQVLRAGPDGYAKPHADMFNQARECLDLPAGAILHVGDHPVTDVQGARLNGFQACWYNDQGLNPRVTPKTKLLPDVEIHALSQLKQLII